MGHMRFDNLVKINKKKAVRDMPEILNPTMCQHCRHGKQTRVEFIIKEHSTSKPLELVHTDLCRTMITNGLDGEQYFMWLIDDYTRMLVVCFMKKKSYAFECLGIYKEMVENETNLKIK